MHPRHRVILLIEATSAFGRGCLRGIARYARAHGGWLFYHRMRYPVEPIRVKDLRAWKGDGVLARLDNTMIADVIKKLKLPTVDLSGADLVPGVASVCTDHNQIVAMAANHLKANGLRNLAYCGFPGVYHSDARQIAFEQVVEAPHGTKSVFDAPPMKELPDSPPSYEVRGAADAAILQTWLRRLPKPVGIIACSDTRARQVLEACEAIDLDVPHEVSVVGVDDDDVVCELSNPPLTSVVPNVEAIGYEAARLLDAMLQGQPPPAQPVLIAPVAIETRNSSDATVGGDPALTKAVQFIRRELGSGINVEDVLEQVSVSRSTLERQFLDHLDCTPHEFILRCRIDRVKQLLLDTEYPLMKIAGMCGFSRVSHMITLFRQRTGMTPTRFRRTSG